MPLASLKDSKEHAAPSAPPSAAGTGKASADVAFRTIEEQVQLVRVFRVLAFEIPRQLVERKLEKLSEKLRALSCGELCNSTHQKRKSCAEYELKHERYRKEHARFLTTLQDEVSNGREMVCAKYHVRADAIAALVEHLGASPIVLSKSRIEDVIWEVNDSLDGLVSFDEFEKSYMRARVDRTGLEPSELFFIIAFLMFDKERSGRIVLDDAMKIFYLKYGDAMEKEMERHFGSKLDEGAQFIHFAEFYDAILKRTGELIDQQASISKSNKYSKRL